MYGIDKTIQSESSFKTIGVGLQDNCEMTVVSFGPSSDKDGATPALAFNYKQDEGATFRFLEFPIDNDREKENGARYYDTLVSKGKTPEIPKPMFVNEYVKRVYRDQAARIKHIMSKFVSEEQCLISGVNTFDAFANAVIRQLGTSYIGKKVRLKLVYNHKDYVTFPRYANFIELQETSPTTLKINPKNDRIKKQTPDPVTVSKGINDNEY